MASASLWPYSAEIIFFIRNSGRAAALPELPFHGVGVVADNGIGCCRAAPEAQRVNPLFYGKRSPPGSCRAATEGPSDRQKPLFSYSIHPFPRNFCDRVAKNIFLPQRGTFQAEKSMLYYRKAKKQRNCNSISALCKPTRLLLHQTVGLLSFCSIDILPWRLSL